MHKLVSLTSMALLLAGLMAGSPGSALARGPAVGGFNNGPIVIDGPIECEKKLVLKCRWVGERRICEWVPSDECEIY